MTQKYNNDTFLARWVENDLSEEELKEFQNSEDYHKFHKINEAAKLLKAPNYNKTSVFNNINQKTSAKNTSKKVFKLPATWMYSAAASILLLFSVFFFNQNKASEFKTSFGEQTTINLPDNSKAHLASDSKITFTKNNWDSNRNLNLTGEAYFEVEKGKTFTVNTTEGTVTVLGTKFTVNTSDNFFEVQCYEGKVKVVAKNNNNNTIILTQGKAFRVFNTHNEEWTFSKDNPSWLRGESEFNNTPLHQVIIALKKQYNLNFNTNNVDLNKRFTGTFTHKNVNIALKTVFAPMKISYTLAKNSTVILTQ